MKMATSRLEKECKDNGKGWQERHEENEMEIN